MEVTYALTMRDIFRFNAYLIRHRRTQQLRLLLSLLLIPALWFGYWFSQPGAARAVPVGVGLGVVFTGLWAALLYWTMRRAVARRNAKIPGVKTVRLYADGLFSRAELVEVKYRWPALTEMAEDADYLFFFIGPLNAVIIPKDAFGGRARAQAFLDHARACWRSVRGGAPPPAPLEDLTTWPPPPQTLAP